MPAQPTAQRELDFQIEKSDIAVLKLLLAEIEEDLGNSRKHLLRKASEWFMAIRIFNKFYLAKIRVRSPEPREWEYFRVSLTMVLAQGERILSDLNAQVEIDTKHIGLDIQDIQSNVQYLRDLYASHFFEVHPSRAGQIIGKLLGDAQLDSSTSDPASKPDH